MTKITYTPQEMIRLELLCYNNPEGLHPVEEAWRNLCRKLMQHVEASDSDLAACLQKAAYRTPETKDWKPFKFPTKFSVDIKT